MKTYRVKEIFGPTLQGEGSHAGRVVNFLRLAGCNRWTGLEKDREKSVCKFCDTDFRGGTPMVVTEIVDKLLALGECNVVVISGGEPTLQLEETLLHALREAGFEIHLETNGSRPLGGLDTLIDHITMSPKQSRADTNLMTCDDVKILYPPPTPDITLENFEDFHASAFYLQPVWDADYQANVRATICRLYGNPTWKLSLQTHKILDLK